MPKDTFLEVIKEQILICDGAMGTMLIEKGLKPGECAEEWNINYPEKVKEIHSAYLDAGCDIILTNTFGGNRFKLKAFGRERIVEEVNFSGARLAKDVASEKCFVGASIGPSGRFLKPYGDLDIKELIDSFSEQIEAVYKGGVDFICIETMSDLQEAKAAITAAKTTCNIPVVTSMTFQKGKRGFRTLMGISPTIAATELIDSGADVIGSNCGNGVDEMIEIISEMKSAVKNYLFITEPNAGIPELIDGRVVYRETPPEMANKIKALSDINVNIIGGCCGTTPEHMKEISRKIKNRRD